MDVTYLKAYNITKLLGISFFVSLFVHLFCLMLIYKFPPSSKPLENSNLDTVALKIVSPKESADILSSLRGQVVDLVDNIPTRKPNRETKFLSDRDRNVDRETQTLMTGKNPNAPFTSMGGGERSDILSFELPRDDKSRDTTRNRKGGGRIVEDRKLDLYPSQEDLSRYFATAPSNFLPNVEIGNATLLNTREFAYAGFFVRMKRQMEAIWDPRSVLVRTSIQRHPTYITSLYIVLNRDGSLHNIRVEKSSGIKELDEEAIRTVKESAPFPNPPKELLSTDQKIHIPRWGFIIYSQRSIF